MWSLFGKSKKIVTRFAPSPTGLLHLGNYRTAVFNYLFAKHHGGTFVLRIEDTDSARSKKEFEEDIIENLKWLHLTYDKFFRQSDRREEHTRKLQQLIQRGYAYISREKTAEGRESELVRFKNPNQSLTFTDLIRGEVTFDTTELKDFIIARSPTEPLFHFAVVADDAAMGVTHVIRGEDHISNTPRQILIQEALGALRPTYAHLPLVLAQDRSKLSKRNGGLSIRELRELGYLSEAVVNYLTLLGWTPKEERELFSIEELVSQFEIEAIHKSGAMFNPEKLRWFNREYLKQLSDQEVFAALKERLVKLLPKADDEKIKVLLPLLRERMSVYSDIDALVRESELTYFFEPPHIDPRKIIWKDSSKETTRMHLTKVIEQLENVHDTFDASSVKASIWPYAEEQGRGSVLWPMRYALTGKERSPDPFSVAAVLGKDETIARLKKAECDL